jgi:ubiquinol-cytochrome c reductase cytochrome c1 subunit
MPSGPDYIHALLTGYDQQPPAGMEIAELRWPVFHWREVAGDAKALSDDQVTYDDGTPQTVDQYSRDVAVS